MASGSQSNFRPLAGRPPFATDEDESVYNRPAQPRPPRAPKGNPNERTSAYNAYDDYFDSSRDSVGAYGVGMGLMGEVSDSDSDDEPPSRSAARPAGKNQALFEAATRSEVPPLSLRAGPAQQPSRDVRSQPEARPPQPSSSSRQHEPARNGRRNEPSQNPPYPPPGLRNERNPQQGGLGAASNNPRAPSPLPPSQAPSNRPPNLRQPSSTPNSQYPPAPVNVPVSRGETRSPMPAPVAQYAQNGLAKPVPAFMSPGSPASPRSPAPLSPVGSLTMPAMPPTPGGPIPASPMTLPPSTPITPLFAAAPSAMQSQSKVTFNDDTMPIMRGVNEDALLERTPKERRGTTASMSEDSHGSLGSGPRQKKLREGDDFWRRFSMAGHLAEEERKKSGGKEVQSTWLEKVHGKAKGYRRWIWIVGVTLLIAVGGGVGIVWYVTHDNPSHGRPAALGGSENHSMGAQDSSTMAAASTKSGTKGHGTKTSTKTTAQDAARRAIQTPYVEVIFPTPVPTPDLDSHRRMHRRHHIS